MVIYKRTPQFDFRTGEPTEPCWEDDHIRCDFTGAVLDGVDRYAYPVYILDYGNQDPCFGCGEGEHTFGATHNIDMNAFLDGPYHINFEDEENFMRQAEVSFASSLRQARMRTAHRLLESGEVEPCQLYGHIDGPDDVW